MSDISQLSPWIFSILIFGVMIWVSLDMVFGILPWSFLDKNRPDRKIIGIFLMIILGLVSLVVLEDLLRFVWKGIQHILFLDLEEL